MLRLLLSAPSLWEFFRNGRMARKLEPSEKARKFWKGRAHCPAFLLSGNAQAAAGAALSAGGLMPIMWQIANTRSARFIV